MLQTNIESLAKGLPLEGYPETELEKIKRPWD